ncbi:MAG: hypothetical protein HW416_750, partial [Chloroflexi bacterium]|nr:hypothetical protein [Chloroflexota bacterium]
MAARTSRRSLAAVSRFLGVVVEVGDQQATRAFYEPIFRAAPTAGDWAQTDDLTYRAGGQRVTFAAKDEPRSLPESGQHQAYRVRADQVDVVVGTLERLGARIDWWHEDPPSERRLMPYTSDPSGNRVQLVPATTPGGNLIDHVAIEVHDIETAQVFYVAALGGRVSYYHGRSVQHYLEGRAWGEGADPCAPWTRFWPGHGLSTNPRSRGSHSHPTQQAFYGFGDCTIGLILAN